MGLFIYRPRAYLTLFDPSARIDGAVYDEQHGGWKYPPDAYIPDISFAIGDHYFVLNAVDFGFAPAGDGYTLGGIQSRGDSDYDIFGDVFLKSLYVVCECQRCSSRWVAADGLYSQSIKENGQSVWHRGTIRCSILP